MRPSLFADLVSVVSFICGLKMGCFYVYSLVIRSLFGKNDFFWTWAHWFWYSRVGIFPSWLSNFPLNVYFYVLFGIFGLLLIKACRLVNSTALSFEDLEFIFPYLVFSFSLIWESRKSANSSYDQRKCISLIEVGGRSINTWDSKGGGVNTDFIPLRTK